MKRDMDLVRRILLDVEKHDRPGTPLVLRYEEWEDVVTSHHVKLMGEAGLIDVFDFSDKGHHWHVPRELTWAGHDFLDAVRADSVWSRVKSRLAEVGGGASLVVVKELATRVSMDLLGIGPG